MANRNHSSAAKAYKKECRYLYPVDKTGARLPVGGGRTVCIFVSKERLAHYLQRPRY
ncbi:MAG: hypothetical protein H7333_05345 [Bdellovibrionales bacterium]|nr:hypothetical protein [Oligoflexia bacterium]